MLANTDENGYFNLERDRLKKGQGRRASAVQPYKDSFPSPTNTMVKEKQKASMRGKANGNPNKNCTACDFCTVLEESLIWP